MYESVETMRWPLLLTHRAGDPGAWGTVLKAIGMHLDRSIFQSVSRATVNGATEGFASCGKGIFLDNAHGFLYGIHVERCATEVEIAADGVVISALSVGP